MWTPKPEPEYEFDMNPYDSFMRKHLQHYGYYTGRNANYRQSAFEDWEKAQPYPFSSDSSDSEYENKALQDDDKDENEPKTTQVVYSNQAGKLVPKLREPRQLYGFGNNDMGPQQAARWPSEIQVLNERVKHIHYVPTEAEPFYRPTGMERMPLSKSSEGVGQVVYEYEPIVGSFFARSRVGGNRSGCTPCSVDVDPNEDDTLMFESRFESGNLAKAVKVGDTEYELWLRNDLYTNKHTQWYYFRVANTRKGATYRFTIVNLMKPDSLYNNGMRPLYYSEKDAASKKIGWRRAGADIKYYRNNVKYSMGKSERCYYSLTWTTQFAHDHDTCYFAHCYPYTYSDLQDYLAEIVNDPVKSKICKQRMLCRTLAGNMVYVLTITSPPEHPEEVKNKKAVVVTSRVHPGETNASWMMKGFLDYLMGSSADAKLLRDTFIFKIVPMLNPDGVIVGNYRCSLSGRDLNRNYKTVLKDSFPSVWNTKTMIKKLMEEREVVVYCDLHGHSRKMNVFIYGCENRGNPQRRLRERVFPVMLSKNAPDKFNFNSCKFKVQKSKEGTGRIVMWNMGIMNSYTMEATFAGSSLGNMRGYHFSTADFESMGFHFCDTLLDYCDPDNTKSAKILVDLEDRLKQEILTKLQRAGLPGRDAADINLDDINLDDIESSDGGSDSSVSDGLPVHLQYVADQMPRKKKKLKTKKERDKQKNGVKEDKKPTEPANVEKKIESQPIAKPKPIKYSNVNVNKRPKSREERANSGVPVFTQERCDDRQQKKSDNYLEALTNAYVRSGMLPQSDHQQQQEKEMPHLRYTAASRPPPGLPINVDGLCPLHDKTFAAHYVANHLQHVQQYTYPETSESELSAEGEGLQPDTPEPPRKQMTPPRPSNNTEDTNFVQNFAISGVLRFSSAGVKRGMQAYKPHIGVRPVTPTGGTLLQLTPAANAVSVKQTNRFVQRSRIRNEDLDEYPRYKYSTKKPSSAKPDSYQGTQYTVERKSSQRHLLEISAAAQRQQDLWQQHQQRQRDKENIDADSPIKQHPPPFDQSLEKDKPHDYVKRGLSATASSSSVTNALSNTSLTTQHSASRGRVRSADSRGNQVTFSGLEGNGVGVEQRAYLSDGPLEEEEEETSEGRKAQNSLGHPSHGQGWVASREGNNQQLSGQGQPPNTLVAIKVSNSVSNQSLSPGGNRSLSSSAEGEISDALRSYHEVRDSLLNTTKQGNLSPTTGLFVDHFVQKTEEEVNQITAELQQDLQNERKKMSAVTSRDNSGQITDTVLGAERRRTFDGKLSRAELGKAHYSSPSAPMRALLASADKVDKFTSNNSNANNSSGRQSRSPSSRGRSSASSKSLKLLPQRNRMLSRQLSATITDIEHGKQYTQRPASRVGMSEVAQRLKRMGQSDDSFSVRTLERVGTGDSMYSGRSSHTPTTLEHQPSFSEEPRSAKKNTNTTSQSTSFKRNATVTTPTKVSLMISQGHQDHDFSAATAQFLPLPRPGKPPLLRKVGRRK